MDIAVAISLQRCMPIFRAPKLVSPAERWGRKAMPISAALGLLPSVVALHDTTHAHGPGGHAAEAP